MSTWIVKASTIVNFEIVVDGAESEQHAILKAKAGDYKPEDIYEQGYEDEWVYDSAYLEE